MRLNSDRIPTFPNSDSYGALRYRIPTSPNSDSYGALRYRTPTSSISDSYGALRYRTLQTSKKRFLRSASLSHSQTLKQRSHFQITLDTFCHIEDVSINCRNLCHSGKYCQTSLSFFNPTRIRSLKLAGVPNPKRSKSCSIAQSKSLPAKKVK